MKKFSVFFVAAALFLMGCGGTKVVLGDFNFTAPSSWTITGQSADKLEVSFGEYSFVIEYATSTKAAAEDLPLATGGEIKVYDLGKCDGFLCYGLTTNDTAAILTFTEKGTVSDDIKYYVMEDAINFAKSISF
jgi:hypothetical protein